MKSSKHSFVNLIYFLIIFKDLVKFHLKNLNGLYFATVQSHTRKLAATEIFISKILLNEI